MTAPSAHEARCDDAAVMIGLLGGTFDPVHFGHLRAALEVYQGLGLSEMRLIPSGRPPHRGMPHAAAAHRLEMLRLACAAQPGLTVDERELRREGPSYSVLTLRELRAELGPIPLCMVLGRDAFAALDRWWHWEEILELCHIVVVQREDGGAPASPTVAALEQASRGETGDLAGRPAGLVMGLRVTRLDISATEVRTMIAAGRSPRYLVPDAVLDYIETNALYARGH